MKERPIIFSAASVQAVLAGRKSQTRRPIMSQLAQELSVYRDVLSGEVVWGHPEPAAPGLGQVEYRDGTIRPLEASRIKVLWCPLGQIGDRLWVREKWATMACYDYLSRIGAESDPFYYAADGDEVPDVCERGRWRSPIYMPHRASRLTLEITDIRVARLQDLTEAEAIAEGMPETYREVREASYHVTTEMIAPLKSFRREWDQLNHKRGCGWNTNPWVWIIEFRHANEEKTR